MHIDFTTISQAVAALAAGAATLFATPPLLAWRRKLGIETLQTVAEICNKVVQAMEQTQGPGGGPTKKALALDIIQNIVSSQGLQVPEPFIHAALEAAVLALQQPPPPPSQPAVVPPTQPTIAAPTAP